MDDPLIKTEDLTSVAQADDGFHMVRYFLQLQQSLPTVSMETSLKFNSFLTNIQFLRNVLKMKLFNI